MLYLKRHNDLLTELFQTVGKLFYNKLLLIHQLQKLNRMEIMMMINAINLIRERGIYNNEPLADSDEMVLGIIYNNLYTILDDFFYFYQYLKLLKNINRKELKGTFEDKMSISYDKMTPFLEEFKSWKKDQIEAINKELDKILLLDLGL